MRGPGRRPGRDGAASPPAAPGRMAAVPPSTPLPATDGDAPAGGRTYRVHTVALPDGGTVTAGLPRTSTERRGRRRAARHGAGRPRGLPGCRGAGLAVRRAGAGGRCRAARSTNCRPERPAHPGGTRGPGRRRGGERRRVRRTGRGAGRPARPGGAGARGGRGRHWPRPATSPPRRATSCAPRSPPCAPTSTSSPRTRSCRRPERSAVVAELRSSSARLEATLTALGQLAGGELGAGEASRARVDLADVAARGGGAPRRLVRKRNSLQNRAARRRGAGAGRGGRAAAGMDNLLLNAVRHAGGRADRGQRGRRPRVRPGLAAGRRRRCRCASRGACAVLGAARPRPRGHRAGVRPRAGAGHAAGQHGGARPSWSTSSAAPVRCWTSRWRRRGPAEQLTPPGRCHRPAGGRDCRDRCCTDRVTRSTNTQESQMARRKRWARVSSRTRSVVMLAAGLVGAAVVGLTLDLELRRAGRVDLAAAVFVTWMWIMIWPMARPAPPARHPGGPGRALVDVVRAGRGRRQPRRRSACSCWRAGSAGGPAGALAAARRRQRGAAWGTVHTVFTTRYARLYYAGAGWDRFQPGRAARATATSPTWPSPSG